MDAKTPDIFEQVVNHPVSWICLIGYAREMKQNRDKAQFLHDQFEEGDQRRDHYFGVVSAYNTALELLLKAKESLN